MKTNFKLLAMAAVAMLAMNSCEKENEMSTGEQKGTPVEFEMGISASTRTATDNASRLTTWVEGDAVGIFAYAKGTTTSPVVTNAKYVLTGDKWVPAAGSEIYPEAAYDYYAYYPYQEGVTDPANISLAALADQTSADNYAKSDVLAAPKTEAEANATTVPLTFKHVYAMVEVQVNGDKVTKQPTSVILKGVKLGGTLNLTAADAPTVTATGNATDVTMLYLTKTENPDAAPFSFRAVVPAQEIAASTPLVTINDVDEAGTDYSMQYSAPVTYESGKYRQINVNIGTERVSLTIPATDIEIDPWGNSEAISGEGEEVVEPVTSLSLDFTTATSFTPITGNWNNSVYIPTGNSLVWYHREVNEDTQNTTPTIINENELQLVQSARGGWNNSNVACHYPGLFEKTTYKVTLVARGGTDVNTVTDGGVVGITISNSSDTKQFKILNESGTDWSRNVTTYNKLTSTASTTKTFYIDMSKASAGGKSSGLTSYDDTTDEEISNGINITLYNYTNNFPSTVIIESVTIEKAALPSVTE